MYIICEYTGESWLDLTNQDPRWYGCHVCPMMWKNYPLTGGGQGGQKNPRDRMVSADEVS